MLAKRHKFVIEFVPFMHCATVSKIQRSLTNRSVTDVRETIQSDRYRIKLVGDQPVERNVVAFEVVF